MSALQRHNTPEESTLAVGLLPRGPLTGEGSGIMIMAIVGGAVVPVVVGVLADRIGIHHSFILPAICYLYIVYYGFRGSTPLRTA